MKLGPRKLSVRTEVQGIEELIAGHVGRHRSLRAQQPEARTEDHESIRSGQTKARNRTRPL
jgi:hypothetical protein